MPQVRASAGADPSAKFAGERGSAIRRADPAFASHRLVDDAHDGSVVLQQSDQRAKGRAPGDKGASPVDRVEHPAQSGLGALEAEFLAKDSALGAPVVQFRPHRQFRIAVGDGHRRLVGFQVSGNGTAKQRPYHRAGRVRSGSRRGDVAVEVGAVEGGLQGEGSGTGFADRVCK